MSIKIAFDNNIFDLFINCPDTASKTRFISNTKTKKIIVYANDIVLSELLSLQQTSRKDLLVPFSALLLEIMGERMFNEYNKIIISEMKCLLQLHVKKGTYRRIKEILVDISKKNQPDMQDFIGLLTAIKTQKANYSSTYKTIRENHIKECEVKKVKFDFKDFEDFNSSAHGKKFVRDNIATFFEKSKMGVSETTLDKIIVEPDKYPYANLWSRIIAAYFYKNIILQNAVQEGDLYDSIQLIYAKDVDHLISNDKNLRKVSQYVYGNNYKVISFDELIGISNNI